MDPLKECGGGGGLESGPVSEIFEVRLVAVLVEQLIEDPLLETTRGIFLNTKFNLH
jgi:hypothetical protein